MPRSYKRSRSRKVKRSRKVNRSRKVKRSHKVNRYSRIRKTGMHGGVYTCPICLDKEEQYVEACTNENSIRHPIGINCLNRIIELNPNNPICPVCRQPIRQQLIYPINPPQIFQTTPIRLAPNAIIPTPIRLAPTAINPTPNPINPTPNSVTINPNGQSAFTRINP